jgi:prepilin-type N-terminal cleavage/methylation domain-containing protein
MKKITQFSFAESPERNFVPNNNSAGTEGFSLIESLMAVLILALGFMFVGPMLFNSVQSIALSRSKDTAGLAAANQLETLARLYKANAADANLTIGAHGPIQVEITNPVDDSKVNRYNISWQVSSVLDVHGAPLQAVQATVTATPIGSGTATNITKRENKIVNVSTIFGYKAP